MIAWRDKYLNKIVCGDCLELIPETPKGVVDLIIIDPPYSGSANKSASGTRMRQDKGCYTDFDDMTERIFLRFMEPRLKVLYGALGIGRHIYCFSDWRQLRNLMDLMELSSYKIVNLICWDKKIMGLGSGYRPQHEFIIVGSKGAPRYFKHKNISNVISIKRLNAKEHPHQKPLDLINIFVENSTEPEEIVVDPFMGVGTVPIAARNLNRKYIGIDINENYCEIARKRLAQEVLINDSLRTS